MMLNLDNYKYTALGWRKQNYSFKYQYSVLKIKKKRIQVVRINIAIQPNRSPNKFLVACKQKRTHLGARAENIITSMSIP